MLNLVAISYKDFKKEIYQYYLELFPKDERKTLRDLKLEYKKGILKFVKIIDENTTVGFLIYETLENNPLILLDYFAIYPEYQNKKYGTKAIEVFKTFFSNYDGVYGEVEKKGLGENDLENEKRARRIKFWESLGFRFIDIDLELFGVVYSPCILNIKDITYSDEKITKYAFSLYNALLGEKRIKKHCRVLKK